MEYWANPAVLGGLAAFASLGGWTLGLLTSRAPSTATGSGSADALVGCASAAARPAPTASALCQINAHAERRRALADVRSLGLVHDDITALRHRERVLARSAPDHLPGRVDPAPGAAACRFIGIIGEPTCGTPRSACAACVHGNHAAAAMRAPRADQSPSASPCALRV